MNKKQKKWLGRILAAAGLLALCGLLPVEGGGRMAAFLVPYAIVGWDVLRGAARNTSTLSP